MLAKNSRISSSYRKNHFKSKGKQIMNISVPIKGLLQGLEYLNMVTKARTSKPILSCVKLVSLPNSLHVEGTDLETLFRWVVSDVIPYDSDRYDKPVIVNCQKLLQMIKSLKKTTKINLETVGKILHIEGGRSKFK